MINIKRLILWLSFLVIVGALTAVCYIEWFTLEYFIICVSISLLLVLARYIFMRIYRHRINQKISNNAVSKRARIINKRFFPNEDHAKQIVLQLQINIAQEKETYTSSYVIDKPYYSQTNFLNETKVLQVFINHKNPHQFIIPDLESRAAPAKGIWETFSYYEWVFFLLVPIAIGVISMIMHISRIDCDILGYVPDQRECLWKLSYERDDSIPYRGSYNIEIFNPNDKDHSRIVKKKKESIPENFHFYHSNDKIWIIAEESGVAPLIDVFDANGRDQLDDIVSFRQKNPVLKSAIVSLNVPQLKSHYKSDNCAIIELLTADGKRIYYEINSAHFYGIDVPLLDIQWKNDSAAISKHGRSWFLVYENNTENVLNLYKAETMEPAVLKSIWALGNTKQDKQSAWIFNDTNRLLECTAVMPEMSFPNGQMIYQDESIVAIYYTANLRNSAKRMISCIDYSGRILFTLNQEKFPKPEALTEYYDQVGHNNDFIPRVSKKDNTMVFLFELHGSLSALCVDSRNGKMYWKYPE